jgi:hypothetical protein
MLPLVLPSGEILERQSRVRAPTWPVRHSMLHGYPGITGEDLLSLVDQAVTEAVHRIS